MHRFFRRLVLGLLVGWLGVVGARNVTQGAPLRVLFLGDSGHHQPRARFLQLQPVFAARNIELVYTDRLADLNPTTLATVRALVLYANIERIEPDQEQALLDYVDQGGGFVPLHCATYCFLNSPRLIALMGAQFQRHGTGVFRAENVAPDHPVMQGFTGFESWDETYVHHQHNERDRTVLEVRVDDEGREPWTWARQAGRGRVFYTAWGHDHRTWGQPGFQALVERGLRWAAGLDPTQVPAAALVAPLPAPRPHAARGALPALRYREVGAQIPNYLPGQQWGVQGEPQSSMQEPLTAAESLARLVPPEGFHVELFAAEPEVQGKPLSMAWDARGRLWVAESVDYPNELQPPGQGRDRVGIYEDTDGDGRADSFQVFAQGLSIPTALCVCRGGLIVQDGTQTVFLADRNGDDRADSRQVLIDNWNVKDTHGGVSNLRLGLDNWIWGMQGYNASQPLIEGREQQAFRMGFFRFRLDHGHPPRVTEFEFLRSTDNNTWGQGHSEEGLVFGSTANHNPSVFLPIANRYYERVRGWTPSLVLPTIADTWLFQPITDKVRQVDQFGGYTAGAGHALYTARRYPPAYWNRAAFVCEPTGHLVGTFLLSPQGSDFRATRATNLLASDDEWTAPIAAEVGPDGNVWTIDWYNYIVQHNPTPQGFRTGQGGAYESELRDKQRGRIHRLIYDAAPPEAAVSLAGRAPEQLVALLAHPNMFWRLKAQWQLVESGRSDLAPGLLALVAQPTVDELGLNVGAIHALWTLAGWGQIDPAHPEVLNAARAALGHRSPGVRRNAIQVLPPGDLTTQWILEAGLLVDAHPQVRLAALLALADQPPHDDAGRAIAEALSRAENYADRWIAEGAIAAAAAHADHFLKAAMAGPASAEMAASLAVVAEHLARGEAADAVPGLLAALVDGEPSNRAAVIAGLLAGWPEDHPLSPEAVPVETWIKMFSGTAGGARNQVLRLARRLGARGLDGAAQEARRELLSLLDNLDQPTAARVAAARQLVDLDPADNDTVAAVLERVTPQTEPELSSALLGSLATSLAPRLGPLVLEMLARLTPSSRPAAVELLLARSTSTLSLLKGIRQGQLQLGELSLVQQRALADHPQLPVRLSARALLEQGGSLPNADRQRVIEELLPVVSGAGDAVAGKVAFKKHCSKCHQHSGEGERIGPDLTGMAVHPRGELLTQILDPNRSVEGNFQTYAVVTTDGRVLSGLLTSESKTAIELVDGENRRIQLLREDIESLSRSGKSLMPEGLEKQVSPAELTDVLAFLTARGRFLPLDLSRWATISSARGMFTDPAMEVERLLLDDWSPRVVEGVPFQFTDPRGGQAANVILLFGPLGAVSRTMPESVTVPCRGPVRALHLLSGVSGWGYPAVAEHSTSLVVRLHYRDGATEDHALINGQEFSDYIRRVDVPGSRFAFALRDQQVRYLAVHPQRGDVIEEIEFRKGPDRTAPVVLAVTLETLPAMP